MDNYIDHAGQFCNQPINICEPSNPCRNNGWCLSDYNIDRGFRCLCQKGMVENGFCVNIYLCNTKMFVHQLFFQSQYLLAPCLTEKNFLLGWTGTLCETNINECEDREGSMFYGGCYTSWTSSCQDLPGSYQCKCISGVTGPKCNIDINECKSNNGIGPCNPLHTIKCTNYYPGYKCACQEGETFKT